MMQPVYDTTTGVGRELNRRSLLDHTAAIIASLGANPPKVPVPPEGVQPWLVERCRALAKVMAAHKPFAAPDVVAVDLTFLQQYALPIAAAADQRDVAAWLLLASPWRRRVAMTVSLAAQLACILGNIATLRVLGGATDPKSWLLMPVDDGVTGACARGSFYTANYMLREIVAPAGLMPPWMLRARLNAVDAWEVEAALEYEPMTLDEVAAAT
jgi:hypothetical protein